MFLSSFIVYFIIYKGFWAKKGALKARFNLPLRPLIARFLSGILTSNLSIFPVSFVLIIHMLSSVSRNYTHTVYNTYNLFIYPQNISTYGDNSSYSY